MKNKLILTVTTMAMTIGLLLSAMAQGGKLDPHPPTNTKPKAIQGPKIDLGTRVDLPCEGVAGGDVASTVRVTNRTAEEIPSLTMVYVDTDNGKAHEALSNALPRRGTAVIRAPKGNQPRTCQAWFFKK